MGDISTWSPVDESNTMAPPDGWPEGQATNTVNNCARALMGGVRRWYDTVTAQLASLTASLASYLPLAGGTLTGPLTGTSIAAGTLTSAGSVHAAVDITAGSDIVAGGDAGISGTVFAGGLNAGGNAVITGTLTTGGGITATGSIGSGSNITAAGNITTAGGTVAAAGVTATGTVAADYVNASQNVAANGTVQGGYVVSTGNIYAAGECRGATLKSDGALTVAGNVASGSVTSSGNLYADGSIDGAFVQSRGSAAVAGNLTVGGAAAVGGDFTATAGYSSINAVQPGADNSGFVGRAGLSYNSMSCYNYVTVSDADLKRDIEIPGDCLRFVGSVPPRTYRWAAGPDQRRHWGLLAQDFEDFPGRLTDPDTGRQQLVVNELLALLWGAVRELSAKVERMEEAAHAR